MAKRGLGKGLQALIPPVSNLEDKEGDIDLIPLDKIMPNSFQPRRSFDEEKLAELAESIKEHGVVQPVVVRMASEDNYELVAGERRWRACKMAGLKSIPAIVKDINDRQVTEIALVENIQREDLNPIEEAWAYKTLLNEFEITQEELSKKVGKSRPFIANLIRLLNLPTDIQELLADGSLSIGHARALITVPDSATQKELADKIIRDGLNVRQTEKLVKDLENKKEDEKKNRQAQKKDISPEKFMIEENLQELLGTKVKLKEKIGGGGKIEIEYYSDEDLQRIIEILTNEEVL